MSTKVYTGIKFKSNNINEVIQQLNSIKKDANNNVIEYYKEHNDILLEFILFNDNACLYRDDFKEFMNKKINNIEITDKEYYETFDKFKKVVGMSLMEIYKRYNDINCDFNITIIPCNGELYGYYDSDIKANTCLLFNLDIATDYYYQNQTDKPENISEDEWETRETIWDTILDNENDYIGLKFNIVDYTTLLSYRYYCPIKKIFDNLMNSIYKEDRYKVYINDNDLSVNITAMFNLSKKYKELSQQHGITYNLGQINNNIIELNIILNDKKLDYVIDKILSIPNIISTKEDIINSKYEQLCV